MLQSTALQVLVSIFIENKLHEKYIMTKKVNLGDLIHMVFKILQFSYNVQLLNNSSLFTLLKIKCPLVC